MPPTVPKLPPPIRVALPLALLVTMLVLVAVTDRVAAWADSPFPLTPPLRSTVVSGLDSVRAGSDEVRLPVPLRLERGQSLAAALGDLGVTPREVHDIGQEMTTSLADHVDPRRLRPGAGYVAYFDDTGALAILELAVEGQGRARLSRDGDSWRGEWRAFERSVRPRFVSGALDGSLEGSIERAGGEAMLAYRMAEVLQWDLDFNRDLQKGDRFRIVYEEVYLDGRRHGVGGVRALVYVNRGRELEAYRFGEDGGYYDGEGRPLEKMFLRSPLPYSRVTSRFTQRRFHPVLKRYRPHYGVDYGAPVGTPVRVTANGVVVSAGWDKGGGNMVKVRHPNDYLTGYLHLSRFAKGMRPGRRVSQGDIIGYVGATGLATGPHLDYRVQHRGRWIDPLTIKSVPAEPIPEADLPSFLAARDELRGVLGQPAVGNPEARVASAAGSAR